ncbi:unnamed protein product [Tenebrio molitor]|nr:unnamed protein product [Tenebrio molitor]
MTGDGQAWVPRMVNFGCSAIVPECGQRTFRVDGSESIGTFSLATVTGIFRVFAEVAIEVIPP